MMPYRHINGPVTVNCWQLCARGHIFRLLLILVKASEDADVLELGRI